MRQTRRKFTAEFKTKVVLEALSERLTLSELAQKHEIHPNQLSLWKREFLENAPGVFTRADKLDKNKEDYEQQSEQLYKVIGQLQVEVNFLKKGCNEQKSP